jgi:glycosyltransferase involved in cell wall biosynthesis
MPVYNAENYLGQALDSFLGQTFSDFELIISDNASTDRTADICQTYAAHDARIRYYRNADNLGVAENYNQVLRLAQAPYFKWAAHDDICAPTLLERCVEVLDQDSTVILCHTHVGCINWQGEVIPPKRDPQRPLDSETTVDRFSAIVLKTFWSYELYGLMRTEVLRQIVPLGGYYGSDRVTLAELTLWGRFVQIPQTLFFRRFHQKQSTSIQTPQARQTWQNGTANKRNPFLDRGSVGFVRAIANAPLDLQDRLLCLGIVLRYLSKGKNWQYYLLPKELRKRLAAAPSARAHQLQPLGKSHRPVALSQKG